MKQQNNTLVETLVSLRGKTFEYAGKQYKVLGHLLTNNGNRVTIKTDQRDFEKNIDDVEDFLSLWVDVEGKLHSSLPATTEKNDNGNGLVTATKVMNNYLASCDSLIEILKDNIEKVKQDPKYVPQATAVNHGVNNIISIEKLKLEMYKEAKTLKTV